jgi:hypothetical protein
MKVHQIGFPWLVAPLVAGAALGLLILKMADSRILKPARILKPNQVSSKAENSPPQSARPSGVLLVNEYVPATGAAGRLIQLH